MNPFLDPRNTTSRFLNSYRFFFAGIHCNLQLYMTALRTFIGVETAALTFRTKQYRTGYSSHICYGKRFYNDFFLNRHTIALVNNFLKLFNCVVIETVLDLVTKIIDYLNSLLSTRKRTISTSSRTVLNAMTAMHVHRQLWLIILLLGIREKVNTGELFSLL